MKWKVFTLSAFFLVLATLLIAPREVKIFKEDKIIYIKELTGRLSRSTAKSFLNRINTLQDKLIIFTSYRESLSHTAVKIEDQANVLFSQEQEFLAINLLQVDGKGSSSVMWSLRNTQNPSVKIWPVDFEKKMISQINWSASEGKGRALWSLKGPQGEDLYIFGLRVEIAFPPTNSTSLPRKTWIIGILTPNAFDDLFADFSTGINKAYVLNEEGVALVTSDSSSKLKSLRDQPLFSDALVKSKAGGANEYDVDGSPVMASSDGIYKTNLVVIVTTPEDKAFGAAAPMFWSVYFIGGALILFAFGLTTLFSSFLTEPSVQSQEVESDTVKNDDVPESYGKAQLQGARMDAFGQLGSGIAREIKNPLAGVLGYIQLALSKSSSEEAKNHLALAEREIRRCKSVIEGLGRLGQSEKPVLQLTSPAQVVQEALEVVDPQLCADHVKVYKDFRPCPMVNVDGQWLGQVVINLIMNACQAMKATQEKNLTVRVLEVTGRAQIHVADTGEGIAALIKDKIFEPFSVPKASGKGMALGLASSLGIIKKFDGELSFKIGQDGQGTDFIVDLPLPAKRVMSQKIIEKPDPLTKDQPKEEVSSSITLPTMTLTGPPTDTITEITELEEEMPPIPEEAIFLEKIRPNTIPLLVQTPTVRNVPEYKVAIRRPKLRL